MEDVVLRLEECEKIAAYKAGFLAAAAKQGIEKKDIPQLIEKSAVAPLSEKILKGLGFVGGGLLGAFPAAAEMSKWVPMAAVGGGALIGATTALAEGQHEARLEKIRRDERKLDRLLQAAYRVRKAREEGERKMIG